LRASLSAGVDLYNGPRGDPNLGGGDPKGCVQVFRVALMSAKPLLADHPELQKSIDRGLADAEKLASVRDQAWALRDTLLEVRTSLVRGGKMEIPDIVPPPVDGKTLWDRLGGEKSVTKTIDDIVDAAVADPRVNFFRDGKFKKSPAEIVAMKKQFVSLVTPLAAGPLPPYHLPSLTTPH